MVPENTGQTDDPQGSLPRNALQDYLTTLITENRDRRIREVLAQRTRKITVLLEDLRHDHNMSAVLRTCDAFGIQDIFVIEGQEPFQPTEKIALGSHRWLTIHRYEGGQATAECVRTLKDRGYRLIATGPPGSASQPFESLPLDEPACIVFGNEREGMTPALQAECSATITIPMIGFVESLNISVAAAIIVQNFSTRLRATRGDWSLSDAERTELLLDWTRKSVPSVEAIESRWREEQKNPRAAEHSR